MKPFIRKKLPFIMIAVQAVLILGILLYIVPGRYRLYDIVLYDAAENVPANPMIGYAPRAQLQEDCADTDLVFILLTFKDWEPREGVFATELLEEEYHVSSYKAAGKNAVVRFVCDVPGASMHRDIPDWLYEKTGGGTAYSDASGKGYAPDYGAEAFLAAHKEALYALASWCLQDSFVAYVEIGSVGPNGSWNPAEESAASRIPPGSVLQQYAHQYEEAFPAGCGIRLLNSAGSEMVAGGGSWDDVLGDAASSGKWAAESVDFGENLLTERADGSGSSKPDGQGDAPASGLSQERTSGTAQTGSGTGSDTADTDRLWTREPVGGGLTGLLSMDNLLMKDLSDTLEQIRSCHISFIGPDCPDAGQQKTNGSEMILRNVGYCLYLSRLQTTVDYIDDELRLHFTFENIGQAPMYWDWPVTMYIYDNDNNCIREQTLDLKLSELLPEKEMTVTGSIPYSRSLLNGFRVGISIRSPEGGRYITLAQKGVLPNRDGIHRVYWSSRKY